MISTRPVATRAPAIRLISAGGESAETCRYFFTFNGDGKILFTPINFGTSNFEYETYIQPDSLTGHVASNSAGVHRFFMDESADKFEISGAGGTITFNPLTMTVGGIFKLNIRKVGSSYTYKINDALIDTTTVGGTSLILDGLAGVRGNATSVPAFSGTQWNTKIWIGGDEVERGTLIYDASIGDNSATIVDSVSANDGVLTAGTGAWSEVCVTDLNDLHP